MCTQEKVQIHFCLFLTILLLRLINLDKRNLWSANKRSNDYAEKHTSLDQHMYTGKKKWLK